MGVAILAVVAAVLQLNAWLVALPIVAAAVAQALSARHEKREWVWGHVLGQLYDFVVGVTDKPNARDWGVNPWVDVGPHDRMRVGSGLRTLIEEFASAVVAVNNAETEYNNHLPYDTVRDRLKGSMKRLLGDFVNGDYLRWERFGKEGGGYWQFDPFFDAYYRETVRNPKSPEATIRATAQRDPEAWGLVIETLQRLSPGTLEQVHGLFVADSSFDGSERLGRRADELGAEAVEKARALRRALEKNAP